MSRERSREKYVYPIQHLIKSKSLALFRSHQINYVLVRMTTFLFFVSRMASTNAYEKKTSKWDFVSCLQIFHFHLSFSLFNLSFSTICIRTFCCNWKRVATKCNTLGLCLCNCNWDFYTNTNARVYSVRERHSKVHRVYTFVVPLVTGLTREKEKKVYWTYRICLYTRCCACSWQRVHIQLLCHSHTHYTYTNVHLYWCAFTSTS